MSSFIPNRESELMVWAANYQSKIAVDFASFGLVNGQATLLTTKNTAMQNAYTVANDPVTRSPANISNKNALKNDFVEYARELGRIIRANPTVTNEQLVELRLTPRDPEPTPIPVPGDSPILNVLDVTGNTITIRLRDAENPDRRGRPDGVAGAQVFTFIGEEASLNPDDWSFFGNAMRTTFDVEFPPTVAAGTKVWISATWFNPRGQNGPACQPVSANVNGGVGVIAEAA